MTPGNNVRVGDADREAVAAQLREHYADGRLTLEELNERLDQAFAAKTRADLNTVLVDLPQAEFTETSLAPDGRQLPHKEKLSIDGLAHSLDALLVTCPAAKMQAVGANEQASAK